jgi:hypothetical protein
MIYGKTPPHPVRDVTDLIGIRTLILRQYWQATATGSQTDLDSQKPDAPNPGGRMKLMGEQTMKERGRMATLWTFQGVSGSGSDVTFKTRGKSIDFGFDPGFSQVPIQAHKDFLSMVETYGGYPGNDGTTVIWPPSLEGGGSGGGGALVAGGKSGSGKTNPMYGIQAYFEMDGIYRYRYAEEKLPKNIQKGVGQIASDVPGEPPPLEDGRNWLKAPTSYQLKGYIYDITEYYWLSRRGGWPAPVYGGGSGGGGGGFGVASLQSASAQRSPSL